MPRRPRSRGIAGERRSCVCCQTGQSNDVPHLRDHLGIAQHSSERRAHLDARRPTDRLSSDVFRDGRPRALDVRRAHRPPGSDVFRDGRPRKRSTFATHRPPGSDVFRDGRPRALDVRHPPVAKGSDVFRDGRPRKRSTFAAHRSPRLRTFSGTGGRESARRSPPTGRQGFGRFPGRAAVEALDVRHRTGAGNVELFWLREFDEEVPSSGEGCILLALS